MKLNSLGKHKDLGLLILRVGLGLTFIFNHGWPKLSGGPDKWGAIGGAMEALGVHFFPVFWGFMCAVVEFGGGILLILGYQLRLACLFLIFNMVVATLSMMAKGGGVMGVAYPFEIGVVFVALLFLGAGKYSWDKD
jgi:putative oxidoreductase